MKILRKAGTVLVAAGNLVTIPDTVPTQIIVVEAGEKVSQPLLFLKKQ